MRIVAKHIGVLNSVNVYKVNGEIFRRFHVVDAILAYIETLIEGEVS